MTYHARTKMSRIMLELLRAEAGALIEQKRSRRSHGEQKPQQ
jgi:hypothetical protein